MQRIKDDETRTNGFHWVNEKPRSMSREFCIFWLYIDLNLFLCIGLTVSPTRDNSARHGKFKVIQQFLVCISTENQILSDVWNGAEISHREKEERVKGPGHIRIAT